MKQKRVEFLRHFNDFRMLSFFTIDVVAISLLVFLVAYSTLALGGVPLAIYVVGSFIITWIIVYLYIKAKKNSSKGFLKHWMFNKGILRLHHDPSKWEELHYSDTKNYPPSGNDKFFAD